MTPDPYTEIGLVRWTGPISSDDPDANFKADVAVYAHADPMFTIRNLAENLGLPVGAVVHYVLARWASAGSAGVLELGPSLVTELAQIASDGAAGDETARLASFEVLRQRLEWLAIPLEDPDRVFGEEA